MLLDTYQHITNIVHPELPLEANNRSHDVVFVLSHDFNIEVDPGTIVQPNIKKH
jgi:hypothetical protein